MLEFFQTQSQTVWRSKVLIFELIVDFGKWLIYL